jgi:hypothetical protein
MVNACTAAPFAKDADAYAKNTAVAVVCVVAEV